jgi:hypothetical protein
MARDWCFGLNPRVPFYFWLKTFVDQKWGSFHWPYPPKKHTYSGFFLSVGGTCRIHPAAPRQQRTAADDGNVRFQWQGGDVSVGGDSDGW